MVFCLLFFSLLINKCTSLSSTTPRVYVPRTDGLRNTGSSNINNNGPLDSNNLNARGGANIGPGAVRTPNVGGRGGGSPNRNSNTDRDRTLILQYPQLLIRYKIPRVKSDLKIQLEAQQESLRQASDALQSQREESSGYSRDRSGLGESSRWTPRSTGDSNTEQKGGFFDKFEPPPAFSELNKKPLRGKSKEVERKGSEGSRPKSSETSRRSKDDGDEDVEDDEDEGGVADENYYGDDSSIGLANVPAAALRNMDMEGYTLEEMQISMYGEYGVKASLGAIKRRLKDDASEKKGKKRSGKTRRDRQNVRNQRFAESRDEGVRLPEGSVIQVVQLAELMAVGAGEVVKHLMMNKGIMTSMTQNIDMALAKEIVLAFGKKLAGSGTDDEEEDDDEEVEAVVLPKEVMIDGMMIPRLPRSPVVTIMGHVDHGKTTLLDTIRKAKVAMGEAGGITQAISAFKVRARDDQFITFIDTPGHAAFSEMRKRGANITDIVVLVVAADDGIMEQTKECIAAAKTANCPIVIAVNKIDKEGADIQTVLTSLTDFGLLVEDFGGDVQCAKVSAKKAIGIDDLLDKLLLQAEIMDLRAPELCRAEGTIIEARMDRRLGVVSTLLVQSGILRVGDYVLAGQSWGRVRRLISDQGEDLQEAGPSTPVQIVGMSVVPNAGDALSVTSNEGAAREVAEARQRLARQAVGSASSATILAQAAGFAQGKMDNRDVLKVPLVIKADVSGSVEAIRSALDALQAEDDEAICKVDVVYAGVGEVTSSDVAIAAVSKAKIIAFNVAAGFVASEDARGSNVDIGYYDVVYTLLDEMEARIKTILAPPPPGTLVGRAVIKKVFKLGKVGKIAGCEVTEGVMRRESKCRVMRGKRNPIYLGELGSLKVVKESVAEVPMGSECGLSFDGFQDFEEGDVIECFVGGDNASSDND
eukprot:gene4903-9777_t